MRLIDPLTICDRALIREAADIDFFANCKKVAKKRLTVMLV